ncbi:hypothetical protein BD31_I0774 [Candidatus Nitrosopumilus salaria BD31]|uniref:Uncharacterized protein n=1 Tax=Candidatus Nitrosopumilus salarius BD31 TaxID=859350 RepID=I3CZW2_9ARCH|nr:hypothetical protein [Candidatus Nitrosopumilus salaria]EIJ65005.1 hypothetical protein BD31_I0774 [Candidatus Nitrosopumilus salaria BD31]
MEVITEFPSIFFIIFRILGIISLGILGMVILKKVQNYKRRQCRRNDNLNTDVDKIENMFNETLRHLDELENFMIQSPIEVWKMELEINSIRGKIRHQLGHIPRMRCNLK